MGVLHPARRHGRTDRLRQRLRRSVGPRAHVFQRFCPVRWRFERRRRSRRVFLHPVLWGGRLVHMRSLNLRLQRRVWSVAWRRRHFTRRHRMRRWRHRVRRWWHWMRRWWHRMRRRRHRMRGRRTGRRRRRRFWRSRGRWMCGRCLFLLVLGGWSGLGEHLTLQRRRRGAQIVRAHGGQDRAGKKNGFRSSHLWTPRPQRASATGNVRNEQNVPQQLRLN